MGHDDGLGKTIFPMNAGKNESDITDNHASYDYDSHAARKTEAFMSTSVNPIFVQNNLLYENNIDTDSTQAIQNSANFLEIRKAAHGTSISNDLSDEIGNRIYPANTTLTDYALNRDETHAFKVKVYDSAITNAETNRKFVYSTNSGTDYPSTNEVGLDIETYDYFILLNPQIFEVGTDTSKSHFAKIKRIVAFDEFGDGLEFSPAYPTAIPINTKFEIYKGPAKTATDVVAVSYGLRGDNSASTPKHDRVNICSLPTWYFYNDRLDEKNQLDYMTKYNLTHLRWWAYPTTISITSASAHTAYHAGSTSLYYVAADKNTWDKLVEGQSIYTNGNQYVGNIASKYVDTTYRFYLDYSRLTTGAISSATNFKIGKTVQNVIFRTEAKFDNTIPNLGNNQLDAILVDNVLTADASASTNFYKWDTAFPKMHRHTSNLLATTANTLDGNLTGPIKYITFEKANFKNNKISMVQSAILNNPRNKMSQLAQMTTLDSSGLQHLKVLEEDTLIMQKNIHNDGFNRIPFIGKVSKADNKLHLKDIKQETDLRHILTTDDIIELDGYYYVVNAISAQGTFTDATCDYNNDPTITMDSTANLANGMSVSGTGIPSGATIASITNNTTFELSASTTGGSVTNGTLTFTSDGTQAFTIKDKKTISATVWTGSSSVENVSQKTMYLMPYNKSGIVNTKLEPDTEVDYASQRISMNGVTVEKENTKLYGARMVVGNYSSHMNKIDTADKNNKFFKMQDANREFYQRQNESASRFYYYRGSYAVSDTVFTGIVEDITSESKNGLTTFKLTGRDDTSKLLSKTITRNTTHSSDVLHTSVPPLLVNAVAITGITLTGSTPSITSDVITFSGTLSIAPTKHSLILNQDGILVGEVESSTSSTITLFDNAYVTATSLKYYHPYTSTYVNYITGTKALASNNTHVGDSLNGFISISEKGFGFNDGLAFDGTFTTSSATFTNSLLSGTSNTGNYLEDRTLGYDISSPKAISDDDSVFAFTIGNENGVTVEKNDIASLNKEMFDVVKINEKSEGNTTLILSPMFPIILGRIDSNSSDTRGNAHLYLVNSNMDIGGFVHRLQPTFSGAGYYGPKETIRYWDLQKIQPGTLTTTYDSIYNDGLTPQKIQSYAVGYKVDADGGKRDGIVSTPNGKPLAGSNTLKNWNQQDDFYGASSVNTLIESYDHSDGGATESDIDWGVFEQIDPRATTYELLATGDLFPYSHLRHNNLGYHTLNFNDFGVVLQGESSVTNTTNHQLYSGKTQQTLLSDNMFEETAIDSASITTNQMRRYGVMRLVEATFDWHFNPIEFDALKPSHEIPLVRYFDYVTLGVPVLDTGEINVGSDGAIASESVTDTVGDYFYSAGLVGGASLLSVLPSVQVSVNGLMAYRDGTALGANDIIDTGGVGYNTASHSGEGVIRFDGVHGFNATGVLINNSSGYSQNQVNTILVDGVDATTQFVIGDIVTNNSGTHVGKVVTISSTSIGFGSNATNAIALSDNQELYVLNIYAKGVNRYKIYRTNDYNIENLDTRPDGSMRVSLARGDYSIRWTDVFIARPNISGTNFKYSLLQEDSGDGTDQFNPHNIILPLVSQEKSGNTNRTDRTASMYHTASHNAKANGATGSAYNYIHMSRVIAGLVDRSLNATSSFPLLSFYEKYNVGLSATNNDFTAHPYDNCIAIFKDVRSPADGIIYNLMSSPLGLDTGTRFSNYLSTLTSENDHDQHSKNLMLQVYGSDTLAMAGTKTKDAHYLEDLKDNSHAIITDATHTRAEDHNSVTATTTGGKVHSAQMIIKPTFDLTAVANTVVYSNSNKTITFTLDDDATHTSLSYMPDLTGHYIVSEKLTSGSASVGGGTSITNTIRNTLQDGSPLFIAKITSHTFASSGEATPTDRETQEITFDRAINLGTNGSLYRLMRPAETTFNKTPKKIEFNILQDSGLKYDTVINSFTDGGLGSASNRVYHEGVYSMYLLLEIDNTADKTYLVKRSGTAAITTFTNNEIIDMYITDGNNSQHKQITVNTTRKKGGGNATENILTFNYDGELTGNGVVSFGKTFEVKLSRKPKLKNITHCHIGTTFTIGSNLEKEVENMVKESGLEYNNARSFSMPTGNLVSSGSTSSTTITCTENVIGIAVDDILYSFDGHLIGKVSNVTNAVITFTKKYYVPAQYDELVTINKKTFVTNLKFDDSNLYNAINSLIVKKGLDYNIKNGVFVTRNIEDTTSLRKYALSYKESGRLVSVGSNKSMFDKANKAIVIGDKIKYELEQPTKKQTRTVKVIDPSIKTEIDAQTRAVELLETHSDDVRKINITLQKEGLEMLEAGDIVRLNFPNHNIPINDYVVFEIENVLAGTLKMTVGTFNKTIAERLSELTTQQSDSSTTQFKKDALEISAGKFFFDAIKLKEIGVSYEITGPSNALSYNSNMGFDDLLGFTEEVGFEHSIVTKKSYGDRFYEQENYT